MTTQSQHDAQGAGAVAVPAADGPHPVEGRAPFSGWVVIGGLFVVLMLSSGIGFYGQGVYLRALVDERQWSTGLTSTATATFFVVSGLAGFAVSGLLQRIDVRRIMVVGLFIAAAGLVALGRSTEVWQAFAADVLFGIGFALCGLVPATTTVARWFVRRRSVALSVASTGLSAGGIVVTPFVAYLVKDRGIGPITPWLALVWLVVAVPVTMLFVRSAPSDKGQHPDGDPPVIPTTVQLSSSGQPATGMAAMPGATFAEARSTRFYQLLTAAYLFVMLGQVGALSQQIKLVSERVDSLAAASVTIVAASSVVGRLGGGLLVTRVSAKTFTTVLMAVQGCALVAFAFADQPWSIIVTCMVFGLSVGNLLMLQPLLLAEAFGVREYSRIYSMSSLVATIGVGAGPTVFGVLHDAVDYQGAFLVGAASSLMAFVLFIAAGPLVSYSRQN